MKSDEIIKNTIKIESKIKIVDIMVGKLKRYCNILYKYDWNMFLKEKIRHGFWKRTDRIHVSEKI